MYFFGEKISPYIFIFHLNFSFLLDYDEVETIFSNFILLKINVLKFPFLELPYFILISSKSALLALL